MRYLVEEFSSSTLQQSILYEIEWKEILKVCTQLKCNKNSDFKFFLRVLSSYLADSVLGNFVALIKGSVYFLERKLDDTWHCDIHTYICLGAPRDRTGMFDNPVHVLRCWSSWTLKDQVSKWFCLYGLGKLLYSLNVNTS